MSRYHVVIRISDQNVLQIQYPTIISAKNKRDAIKQLKSWNMKVELGRRLKKGESD